MTRVLIGVCRKSKKLFELFDVIEIQETFYNIPKMGTVERWSQEARSTKLTFKVFQGLTHDASSPTWRRFRGKITQDMKNKVGSLNLNDVTKGWIDLMVEFSRILNSPLIIVQTPAKFKPSDDNVRRAIDFFRFFINRLTESGVNTVIGWEPRGDWLKNGDALRKVVSEINELVHIVDPFFFREVEVRSVSYFRLHGKPYLNYKYRYSDNDLHELLKIIDSRKDQGAREVYVLFNNVTMVDDALKLKKLLEG